MHQNPEERIKRLERSVQRWRLISLALLLTLVSCLAISCTFGIVWFLRGVDDEFLMIHAERDRAEEEHQRAVQAQREAEARLEVEAVRERAEADRMRAQIEELERKLNAKELPGGQGP